MPQLQLPIFPARATPINPQLAVAREADRVVYVHGHLPVFQHGREDLTSFRGKELHRYHRGPAALFYSGRLQQGAPVTRFRQVSATSPEVFQPQVLDRVSLVGCHIAVSFLSSTCHVRPVGGLPTKVAFSRQFSVFSKLRCPCYCGPPRRFRLFIHYSLFTIPGSLSHNL